MPPQMPTQDVRPTLTVFGVTGRTGQAVLGEAVRRGWAVRALVRGDPGQLRDVPGLTTRRGPYTDDAALDEVLRGTAAALCVFGPRSPHDLFCADATRAVIRAMGRTGVERLVVQTGSMVGQKLPNWTPAWRVLTILMWRTQPEMLADRLAQEEATRTSGLNWTIVKPPRLTDLPASHRVRAGPDVRIGLMASLARADLAAFLLDEVEQPRFHRQTVLVQAG